jgi:tetratricopeptide (TPR) repeat protein
VDEVTLRDLQAGFRLQQAGDLERAAASYQHVLARDPANEFALNLLGVVCLRRGEFAAAIEYLRRALVVNDRDPETHNNLALGHKGLHEFPEAGQAFRRSLELKPGQPVVLNNLGNVLASLNQHRQAIRCFESALVLHPDYVDCLGNLCTSLLAERQFVPALRTAARAIDIAPRSALARHNKGRVLAAMLRHAEAAECFESAIALDPGLIDARIQLSTVLKLLRREALARATLDEVLRIEPANSEAHKCMGVLLEQTGDFAGAARHFRLAIQSSPRNASAYYQLSKLGDQRLTQEECNQVRHLLDDEATHEHLRGPLHFALACDLEKQHDYAGSLVHFIQGNRARSNQSSYDSRPDDAYFAAIQTAFPVQRRPGDEPVGAPGSVPIFVLGMPRSGTTLTEQILASHSRIAGAGESGALSDLALRAAELVGMPFPQCCAALSTTDIQALRARYFSSITELVGSREFFVDKTPMNYQLIGFIVAVFPEARIVFCKRGALDNCLSIFRLPFDENQSYSHDLESLGHYYRNHERLMSFWLGCYPDRILVAEYEKTVDDLELQARRLLAFIGVEYEPGVLRFYDSDRMVLTPSAQQVRRPIYRSSVDAWRRYGEGLRPLVRALEADTDRSSREAPVKL